MRDKPVWYQATSKPPSMLIDFCDLFRETWLDEKMIERVGEEKVSSKPEEFVSNLEQLEGSIQVLIA